MPSFEEPGSHTVDVPIICVITRFGLRSPHLLLPTYLDYRRVANEAKKSATPGLLQALFLVENFTTCYSVSIWEGFEALSFFGTKVRGHVGAARRAFGRVSRDEHNRAEIWSTKWRLESVSNNLSWQDFDLRARVIALSK